MKYFFTFIMVIGFGTMGFSQLTEECFVLNKEALIPLQQSPETRLFKNATDFEPVTFNIFFWGFRKNDNTGNTLFTLENIEASVARLNELYNNCNVSFVLLGYETIPSSQFYKLNHPFEFAGMLVSMRENNFFRSDAFNVYVSNEYSGFGGIAEDFYKTTIGIPAVQLVNPGTIEHEIGHCFGLLHTNETIDRLNCESVIRDPNNQLYNADITGDFVTDTAASFKFSPQDIDPETCTYIGNEKDCYGYQYKIPPSLLHNYMTISAYICVNDRLTSGQHLRIRQGIEFDFYGQFSNAIVE